MLIGGDDISNDIINLGTCSMFVYKQAFPHHTQDHAYENMWGEICQSAPESLLAGVFMDQDKHKVNKKAKKKEQTQYPVILLGM